MSPLWMSIEPDISGTRIMMTQGGCGTIMRARLPHIPKQPEALGLFLRGVGAWYGRPFCAVLDADAQDVWDHQSQVRRPAPRRLHSAVQSALPRLRRALPLRARGRPGAISPGQGQGRVEHQVHPPLLLLRSLLLRPRRPSGQGRRMAGPDRQSAPPRRHQGAPRRAPAPRADQDPPAARHPFRHRPRRLPPLSSRRRPGSASTQTPTPSRPTTWGAPSPSAPTTTASASSATARRSPPTRDHGTDARSSRTRPTSTGSSSVGRARWDPNDATGWLKWPPSAASTCRRWLGETSIWRARSRSSCASSIATARPRSPGEWPWP